MASGNTQDEPRTTKEIHVDIGIFGMLQDSFVESMKNHGKFLGLTTDIIQDILAKGMISFAGWKHLYMKEPSISSDDERMQLRCVYTNKSVLYGTQYVHTTQKLEDCGKYSIIFRSRAGNDEIPNNTLVLLAKHLKEIFSEYLGYYIDTYVITTIELNNTNPRVYRPF